MGSLRTAHSRRSRVVGGDGQGLVTVEAIHQTVQVVGTGADVEVDIVQLSPLTIYNVVLNDIINVNTILNIGGVLGVVVSGNLVSARTWHDNTPFMKKFMEMLKSSG